jgi:hypothetical protein
VSLVPYWILTPLLTREETFEPDSYGAHILPNAFTKSFYHFSVVNVPLQKLVDSTTTLPPCQAFFRSLTHLFLPSHHRRGVALLMPEGCVRTNERKRFGLDVAAMHLLS